MSGKSRGGGGGGRRRKERQIKIESSNSMAFFCSYFLIGEQFKKETGSEE